MIENLGIYSFILKSSHSDYKVFSKQANECRRLYNGLNAVARISYALRLKEKLTDKEEQTTVDTRLLTELNAQNWVATKPNLAGSYSYETLRKNISLAQNIVLPQKVAQRVGTNLAKNWKSFYGLRKKGLYSNAPKFKQKFGVVEYTKQALSLKNKNWIVPTGWNTGVKLPPELEPKQIRAARLINVAGNVFKLEIIYKPNYAKAIITSKTHPNIASIDLGLNALATIVTTKPNETPKIVDGRCLKSINQYTNKKNALLRSKLDIEYENLKKKNKDRETFRITSTRKNKLWLKRNRKINHYLNTASTAIISYLLGAGTGVLIIGWNSGFKDKINIGKKNNQNFVNIPHARFRDILIRKATIAGIATIVQEESYTSKASFIDNDEIPIYQQGSKTKQVFSGKRIKRGVYKSNNGTLIHADVNGAWNIMRKSIPTISWGNGIVVMPQRLIFNY